MKSIKRSKSRKTATGLRRLHSRSLDPEKAAKTFLATTRRDDAIRLRYWRGDFLEWNDGRYVGVSPEDINARLTRHINRSFTNVTRGTVNDVIHQVKALGTIGSDVSPPCWLVNLASAQSAASNWSAEETVVFRNGVVHLPTLLQPGRGDFIRPASPQLFTLFAADYDFDMGAAEPVRWLDFLNEIFARDQASIELLQDWFGYMLTPDTKQQKMLLLIGPPRSGKGTIARVLRSLVGSDNVCGPTLSSLTGNFGLQPLLGKTVAIISDARLSGRVDQLAVVERLLSITGEDAITVDRKHRDAITATLPARFTIISNELPRLAETSGALSNRFVVLKTAESFLGQEDTNLTNDLLAERSGILLWAIDGWRRLRERGAFVEPATIADLRETLADLSNPIGEFVRDCCDVGKAFEVERLTMYRAYVNWCNQRGLTPRSDAWFGRDLSAAFNKVGSAQRTLDGERVRVYTGLRLRG